MDEIDREEMELSLRFYRSLLQNDGVAWADMLAAIGQIKAIEAALEQEDALEHIGQDSKLETEAEDGR